MKRALILFILLAAMLAAGLPLGALAQGGPVFITETSLSFSEQIKHPHIDTLNEEVLVSGNAERSVARLWTKGETAMSFPNPRTMGFAEGTPDYTTTSIFVTDTGVVHYAWINEQERRIYVRTKGPDDTDFRPRVTAFGAATPYEAEVAANEDGVFVFWREIGKPIRYRRSPDGLDWSAPAQSIGTVQAEPLLDVAAGSGRRLAVAFYRGIGDFLQCYLAVWDGSGFVIDRIPTVTDRSFANPSVALRPDGGYAVAVRSTEKESGLGAGVYIADRLPTGAWLSEPAPRLARGDTLSVSLDADPVGNIHLLWVSREAGPADLYYTFRRNGEGYGGSPPAGSAASPLRVQAGNAFITNVRAAASLRDRSYGHAALERFDGGTSFGRYYLFGLPVNIVDAASISIENGAAITNKPTVRVTFSGLSGNPSEVRWGWNAPPAAGTPYLPFDPANPAIDVPVPGDANPGCAPLTLYTQLRAGSSEQQTPNSATIGIDRAVQAEFFIAGPPPALSPGYTNVLSATVFVYGAADCAGVATTVVSGPIAGGAVNLPVAGQPLYGQTVALTGDPAAPEVKELAFLASDGLGNTMPATATRQITFDPVGPTLISLADETEATLVPNPNGTTQLALALDNLNASDTGGIVAGIELVVTSPPVDGTPVTSGPLRIPFTAMDQVTTNQDGTLNLRDTISLTRFFTPAQLVPGTYSFTFRVVDGAGNASETSVVRSETLSTITFPAWAPLLRR